MIIAKATNHLYVITGGPGVGKTTLLNAMQAKGFFIVPEEARRIIQQQMQINGQGLPWKNKVLYARLMLEASLETYKRIIGNAHSNIFFDRGTLDAICYMRMQNIPISNQINNLVKRHPYNSKVFILPPWEEIYATDNERMQTLEEAVFTYHQMKQTYLEYGYEIIEIPKISVENRCEFILKQLHLVK